MERRKTKEVKIGNIRIGGNNPVAVQSMLCRDSSDAEGNIAQAKELYSAGCSIIRLSVPDINAAHTLSAVKNALPNCALVADIHFDYKLALEAADAGADKIRINPGNIGSRENVKKVAAKCREKGIPIRIGVNSGSVSKDILAKYGKVTPQALCESAKENIDLLLREDFDDIVISIKSSDVITMIESYKLISEKYDFPLHLGVTEAGTMDRGLVKSSVGIGHLLLNGIGDTIRVSLTAEPVNEVYAGYNILRACGLVKGGVEIVSCPTCGRTKIDIIGIAQEAEKRLSSVKKDITVAIMGCAVNGPGEAKNADIGIAGGNGEGLIFKKGVPFRKVPENELIDELMKEIEKL